MSSTSTHTKAKTLSLPFTPDPNYAPYTKGMLNRHYSLESGTVSEYQKDKYEHDAAKNWDQFYKNNTTNFFKDRHWLHREFPELQAACTLQNNNNNNSNSNSSNNPHQGTVLLEVGSGVGNTVFPLIESDQTNALFVYAFDFSRKAIQLLNENPLCYYYNTTEDNSNNNAEQKKKKKRVHGFVCDVANADIPTSAMPDGIADFVTMIFVMSAMAPEKMPMAVQRIAKKMKSGALLFFRDYAVNDLTQSRLSKYRKISDNLFARGDGTRTYFFDKEFLKDLFEKHGFETIQNEYCRKTVVNHKEEKQMDRTFLQAKFRKL